jgi:hypothetical protein
VPLDRAGAAIDTAERFVNQETELSLRAQRSNLVPTETPRHEIASSRKARLAMTRVNLVEICIRE